MRPSRRRASEFVSALRIYGSDDYWDGVINAVLWYVDDLDEATEQLLKQALRELHGSEAPAAEAGA